MPFIHWSFCLENRIRYRHPEHCLNREQMDREPYYYHMMKWNRSSCTRKLQNQSSLQKSKGNLAVFSSIRFPDRKQLKFYIGMGQEKASRLNRIGLPCIMKRRSLLN